MTSASRRTLFDLSAWFGWRAGKEQTQRAKADLSAAQQDLIVRVVQAYFGVLRAQDNLRASQARERAFERQLEQTRQRFEVGLIAITDVYEAEAARDLAQVNRIVDENNVAVAKENLSVLTGQTPGALYVLGEEFDPRPPEPGDRADVGRLCHVEQLPPCRGAICRGILRGRTPPLHGWATRQP